jgi:hypothetical protein
MRTMVFEQKTAKTALPRRLPRRKRKRPDLGPGDVFYRSGSGRTSKAVILCLRKALLKKIAVYFFLPTKLLLDDEEKLPPYEQLKIDEDLAAIQRNDLEEQMNYVKNRHYLSRNYRVLSHATRVKMILSLFLILAPLAAFTGYSAYDIIQSRNEDVAKFQTKDIRDSTSKKFAEGYIKDHTKDATNSQNYTYCDVRMGVQVLKVFDIKPSNEYFSVALKVWFDFSQDDFHAMYMNYKSDDIGDADFSKADSTVVPYGKDMDLFSVSRSDNSVTFGGDSIPDHIELATPYDLAKNVLAALNPSMSPSEKQEAARSIINANPALTKLRNYWVDERMSYPGLTPARCIRTSVPTSISAKGSTRIPSVISMPQASPMPSIMGLPSPPPAPKNIVSSNAALSAPRWAKPTTILAIRLRPRSSG